MNTRDGSSSKTDDEENCVLVGKAKKVKGKASHSKSDPCHGGKKKDMSKVKFFHCHELGHFSTNYWLNKYVDGVGPANMSGDLPGKNSQLDLRPFGVGVLAVGHMVMP